MMYNLINILKVHNISAKGRTMLENGELRGKILLKEELEGIAVCEKVGVGLGWGGGVDNTACRGD